MSNYTTQTAALKAVTIDTTTIDAKRIDTKKLFVNGVSIDELQGSGGSGVESLYTDYVYMIAMTEGEIVFSLKIPFSTFVTNDDTGIEEDTVSLETLSLDD